MDTSHKRIFFSTIQSSYLPFEKLYRQRGAKLNFNNTNTNNIHIYIDKIS